MKKIPATICIALFALNFFAWQEVFYLQRPKLLEVVFFDVGQGDSALIKTPEGRQILIDGGPDSSVLEKLSQEMPFADRTIDAIILTHPEKDHFTGFLDVLERYDVQYVFWTGTRSDNAEYKKWTEAVENEKKNIWLAGGKKENTKIFEIKKGANIRAGNVLIETLSPEESFSGVKMKNSSNDSGIVSLLKYGEVSFLFTGDIAQKTESRLANSYGLANAFGMDIDVLKVAHHGSKYSTSEFFLQNTKPEFAVISVGKNSYGHPTPEVLQRLEKFGIKVLRTDRDGDVKFLSDGKNLTVKK